MQINADLHQRVVIDSHSVAWQPSPLPGVERRPLERMAAESGRATSIVRYAAGSSFKAHEHPLGEEIFVLQGTFADEHGVYPAGTWLKNPPGSRHAPSSPDGCLLFVKLCHMTDADTNSECIDTLQGQWLPGQVEGLSVLPLDSVGSTHTSLVRWAPGTHFAPHRHMGGEEILVLEGVFQDELGVYPAGTWIRSPHGSAHKPFSETGCLIYVKVGHL
ncbi:anti-ECFsigma factor, ChrR [Pseudomonas pohangensis]|uniref:Anti-ECFsigma factor, ChrR n=1 Tax=Pseudomonas pohangensis TaxID=364197 RepID=A0A1H2FXA6_9PSED|nr:cupin domain-containing protein [Pseudomonas pohangensis]SDU11688.1 anti-ECFsigma factor, ChrR [Pseudomonas pohangensis]